VPETVEILCLANSFKHGGRCVAGLRTDGGGWVRPVGQTPSRALTIRHTVLLPDFTDLRPLDLIRVTLDTPTPKPHHPEDWLVTDDSWELVSRPGPRGPGIALTRSHFIPGPELMGCADGRVPYAKFEREPATQSLALIHPEIVRWHVSVSTTDGKRRTRARFPLGSEGATVWYDLPITDPEWLKRTAHLDLGEHAQETVKGVAPTERLLLTVSLSEPRTESPTEQSDAYCYKLVASVMPLPPEWRLKVPERAAGA
jgi:hypothetical protein